MTLDEFSTERFYYNMQVVLSETNQILYINAIDFSHGYFYLAPYPKYSGQAQYHFSVVNLPKEQKPINTPNAKLEMVELITQLQNFAKYKGYESIYFVEEIDDTRKIQLSIMNGFEFLLEFKKHARLSNNDSQVEVNADGVAKITLYKFH